jgi:hypothetical protein
MVNVFSAIAVLAIVWLPAEPGKTINLELKQVRIADAIVKVVEASGGSASYVMSDPLKELEVPITLELHEVSPATALRAICGLAGLTCEESPEDKGALVISRVPGPPTLSLGGKDVPVIAATTYGMSDKGGAPGFRVEDYLKGIGAMQSREQRPSFYGEDRLVDLDVKDAPLAEVAAKLSWKAESLPTQSAQRAGEEGGGVRMDIGVRDTVARYVSLKIVAADPVKDIKVTARVYRWPLGKVLDMLLEQTGLVCTKDESGRVTEVRQMGGGIVGFEIGAPYVVTLYLVPRPEFQTSGSQLGLQGIRLGDIPLLSGTGFGGAGGGGGGR